MKISPRLCNRHDAAPAALASSRVLRSGHREQLNYRVTPKHDDPGALAASVLICAVRLPPPARLLATPHTQRAAAQKPSGEHGRKPRRRPRLARQLETTRQGWLAGPGHMDGSVGGRGEAPTLNPDPPRLGRLGVGCIGLVIYVSSMLNVPWPAGLVYFQ